VTHRQYAAWLRWLESEMDRPDRSDYYAMSIAAEVRRTHAKDVKLEDLRLRSKLRDTADLPGLKRVTREQAAKGITKLVFEARLRAASEPDCT
jgi:hypothetical protein